MIKIKTNLKEFRFLKEYINDCILHKAKSIDHVKEYLLADALNELHLDIEVLLFKKQLESRPDSFLSTLKIDNRAILALSIYFHRYQLPNFLLPLQTDIIKKMPTEIIGLFDRVKHQPKPTDTYTINEMLNEIN